MKKPVRADTDKPMEVVRPNTRWQDPDIKLDPTQMMTFPMTVSTTSLFGLTSKKSSLPTTISITIVLTPY